MEGDRAFFQIAVALIPVLLFGGVLIERLREPPDPFEARHRTVAIAMYVLVPFVLAAELAAIRGAIFPRAVTGVDRFLVVTSVVGGTALLLLTISTPWLRRLGPGRIPLFVIGLIVVLVIGAFS